VLSVALCCRNLEQCVRKSTGAWAFPHPWVNLFVPASKARTFIGETLDALSVDDVGQGPILIYPFNRGMFNAPFFRVPDGRHFFVFSLLRNAVPPTPERAAGLVADNRVLFDRATVLGGRDTPSLRPDDEARLAKTLSACVGRVRCRQTRLRPGGDSDAGAGKLLNLSEGIQGRIMES
jgi:hypothetical protein